MPSTLSARPFRAAALAALSAAALACSHALAAHRVGEAAPKFTAPASLAGKAFIYSLRDALQKGPVVVYFYPSAFTGGCSLQAHTFAINQDKFTAAGASIIGVSLDSIQRLNEFSADPDACGGKFPVASDTDGRIAQSFDLAVQAAPSGGKDSRGARIDHGLVERTTFVISRNGRISAVVGGLAPQDNVEQALAAVQKLAAQAPRP